jgi:cholesterol oxidase
MSKFTRREFLSTSILGTMGFSIFGRNIKSWAFNTEYIPALVIGSGFGGAVAALRLAENGIDTLVLERGIRWPITPAGNTFATFENPDGRAGWLADVAPGIDDPPIPIDVFTGVMEVIQGNGMNVRVGAGVGGGSLVYNAILLKPNPKLFKRVIPRNIATFNEMDSVYYPRVLSMLGASPIPSDILATDFYKSTRINLEQAERAGFSTRLVDFGVDWNIVREEIAGTKVPSAIDGQSWYGLNSGAKTSVDHNYLPLAEATGRVEILPLHVVTEITRQFNLYFVSVNVIDTEGNVVEQKEFACTYLFLAAGSMGTSSLLVKSKAKGTLPRLHNAVGSFWAGNGDFIPFRAGLPSNNAGTGGPCGHILMENRNRFGSNGLVELVVPKSVAFDGASLYVGMGIVRPVGHFDYDPTTDSVNLTWPIDHPGVKRFEKSAELMVQTLNEANTDDNFQPFNAFFSAQLTAHPLGGAALGRVCTKYGQVRNYPGLYVVDGAMLPRGSTGGVNPALTIAALAERNMEFIIERDIT